MVISDEGRSGRFLATNEAAGLLPQRIVLKVRF
jgi:hypothetical protein